jgi:hypothetical protein
MKKLLTIAMAALSVGAFANTVYLDSDSVDLGSNQATLEKTSQTPTSVNLVVTVPTQIERCDDADMRVERRTITSGARCGYDTVRTFCGGGYGRVGYPTGPRYNPRRTRVGGRRGGRVSGGIIISAGTRYNPIMDNMCTTTVARTCTVSERYCSNPQYVTVDKIKNFNLQFDKFNKNASIAFSLDQNNNLELDVLNINESCVKKTIYGNDGVTTGAKLKLKRRCR